MLLSQIFGTLSGVFALVAYAMYFRQMAKGDSTPNPVSWLIFFLASVINSFTYFSVVQSNIWQSLFVIVITACLFAVLVYSLFKGKFTKIHPLEIATFVLAILVGIYWQMSDNARIANLALQAIYVIGYIPTYVGLIKGYAKENHASWAVAVVAYIFATFSLVANFPADWIAFVSPILNGIIGNGIVIYLILRAKRNIILS